MKTKLKEILRMFFGSWKSRNVLAIERNWAEKNKHLCYLQDENSNNKKSDKEAPIFIFSAGWRSGSTLLQRLILSSEDILIWGEPYDKSNIVESMSQSIVPLSDYWPPESYYLKEKDVNQISNDWIANLYPQRSALKASHRTFFDTLFKYEVNNNNIRWGVKEVRWGEKEARYLKWLYPNAKFIFLVRDPFKSYNSFKAISTTWFSSWPFSPVYNPYTFVKHWNRLVSEFLKVQESVEGIFIKYEDLIDKDDGVLEEINAYLDINIDPTILKKKVGSTVKDEQLPLIEKGIIYWVTRKNYRKLYQKSGST